MLPYLHALPRGFWRLSVVLLVLLALYVSGARQLMSWLPSQQDRFSLWLGERLGATVQLSALEGDWRRFSPVLRARDVIITDPQGTLLLQLGELELIPDLLNSLQERQLRISHARLADGVLRLQESRVGEWSWGAREPSRTLTATPAGQRMRTAEQLLAGVLQVERLQLNNLRLVLQLLEDDPAELRLSGRLTRSGELRRGDLQLWVNDDPQPIVAMGEAQGNPLERQGFSGNGYFSIQDSDLAPLLPLARAFGVDISDSRVSGQLWLRWDSLQRWQLNADIRNSQLNLISLVGPDKPALLADVNTHFYVEHEQSGQWQGWVESLRARLADNELAMSPFIFGARQAQWYWQWQGLDLSALRRFLQDGQLLPSAAAEVLAQLAPEGRLQGTQLQVPVDQRGLPRWRDFSLYSGVEALGLSSWHHTPTIQGARGTLRLGLTEGVFNLAATDLQMGFPGVYREPIAFDRIRAQVRWRQDEQGWRVDSGPMQLELPLGRASALLGLALPTGQAPEMMLAVGLEHAAVADRGVLLPSLLEDGLQQWLTHSLSEGEVRAGGFVYRGSLHPERSVERTVQLRLEGEQLALDYHPDWPALREVDAQIYLDDQRLQVEADQGAVLGDSRLQTVAVHWQHGQSDERLHIQGDVTVAAAELLDFLRTAPALPDLAPIFEGWQLSGAAIPAQLQLAVPLQATTTSPLAVSVTAQLTDQHLALNNQRLNIEALQGTVLFDLEQGLRSPQLRGQLFQRDLQGTLAWLHGAPDLQLTGTMAVTDLLGWLELPPQPELSGVTTVAARLWKPSAEQGLALAFHSDLRGWAADYPAPLNKAALEAQAAEVRVDLQNGAWQMELPGRARLAAQRGEAGWQMAGRFGAGVLPDFPAQGLAVTGEIAQLDPQAWQQWWERRAAVTASSSADTPPFALTLQQLQVARVAGLPMDRLTLTGEWQVGAIGRFDWETGFASGRLHWQAQQTPQLQIARLDLDQLLPSLAAGDEGGGAGDRQSLPALPALQITLEHLLWQARDQGSAQFLLELRPEVLLVQHLQATLPYATVGASQLGGGSGATLVWEYAGSGQTALSGRMQMGNLAQLLRWWGYEPVIESERGSVEVQLSWPGSPWRLDLAQSEGTIDLDLRNGRFLSASAATSNTLRVVGILNLSNLVRRLRLDFSDIYKEGVSYDKVRGRFALANGQLQTPGPLLVTSPSSSLALSCLVDLDTQQIDGQLVATLPLATNLPWFAALATGLPTAAAVYLAGKLFENQVDRFSSAHYTLSGTWDNFELTFQQIFGMGGATENRGAGSVEP